MVFTLTFATSSLPSLRAPHNFSSHPEFAEITEFSDIIFKKSLEYTETFKADFERSNIFKGDFEYIAYIQRFF